MLTRGKVTFSNVPGCFSINNSVYFNFKSLFLCDFVIFGLIFYSGSFYVYGGTEFVIYKNSIKKISFKSWILDIQVGEDVLIVFIDGTIYSLNSNKVLNNLTDKLIFSAKFDSNEIIYGSHEKVFVGNLLINSHKGRVFAVCKSKFGWMSAGEDRKVVISDSTGQWEILEDKNYVIKCGIGERFCYTINRDGTLKIYKNRKMILCLETCFLGISDIFINENLEIFVGLSNGNIVKLKNKINNENDEKVNKKTNDKIFLEKMVIDNQNCKINKTVIDNKEYKTSGAILKSAETKKHVHLLLKKKVVIINKEKGKIIKEIEILKPSCVRGGIIGTRRGFALVKGKKIIICEGEIQEIYKTRNRIYFKTAKERVFIYRKYEDINDEDKGKSFVDKGEDVNKDINIDVCNDINVDHKENANYNPFPSFTFKSFFRPCSSSSSLSLHKNNSLLFIEKCINEKQTNSSLLLCFREISTAIRVDEYILCGTLESKLVLFDKNLGILDCVKVDGQISKIYESFDMIVCGTKRGIVYLIRILKRKIWLTSFKNKFKICDVQIQRSEDNNDLLVYILDSGGFISIYDTNWFKIKSFQIQNEFCCCFLVVGDLCFVGTASGKLIELNTKNNNLNEYKVLNLSIFSIIKDTNCLLAVGDDHNLAKFDLKSKKIEILLVGSDPLVQILMHKNKLKILSRTGRLWTISKNLKIEIQEKVVCDVSNCMVGGDEMICFGDGIQKLK
ncbi:Sugar transporter [Nosema bombycis CQ1]|uniref:Sugar transporter n=1 Tax=Nosema bombycis (strain CQ1 / CVCC 102059) TaxID=578461 RepID=R0MPQ8_NOSB1|nr:Sugar transporter [Nosema bombycis CQ1]|eukprot:EOB14848.1 Sugar transporter [Nosema bombycis CQ1]